MKAKHIDSEVELEAEFDLAFEGDSVRITLHSRGGSKSQGPTNPEYELALQLILQRLAHADSVLEEVRLASKPVIHLPPSQRRIELPGLSLPLRLSEVDDLIQVRLAIRRGAVRTHNTSEKVGHGNATKRIEIVASASLPFAEMVEILEWGDLGANQVETPTHEPLSKSFVEGNLVLRTHLHRERSRALVMQAKANFIAKHGHLFCEVCGFDFEATYGELGAKFIEAHHEEPLGQKAESSVTHTSQLRMVCPNCHRMLHKSGIKSVVEVKLILRASN